MKIYVYCSYKLSPVGFQPGVIEYDPDAVDDYIPKNEPLNKFVMTAFGEGIVKRAFGLMPGTSKYIYVVKQLQKNNVVDANEGEIDLYMNLAFEFDGFEQYKNFVGNFDSISTEEAIDECAKFIVPDRSVKSHALKLGAAQLKTFVEKMTAPFRLKLDDKKLYVEVVPSKPREEQLQSIFGCAFEHVGDKLYVHPVGQKKNPPDDGNSNRVGGNSVDNIFSGIQRRLFG